MELKREGQTLYLNGLPIGQTAYSLGGASSTSEYTSLKAIGDKGYYGISMGRLGAVAYRIEDRWSHMDNGVRITRELETYGHEEAALDGINIRTAIPLGRGQWRFFIPAACYDFTPNEEEPGFAFVSEERAAYPLVLAFDEASGTAYLLVRETPARASDPPVRRAGELNYLHPTEIGAIGYQRHNDEGVAHLLVSMPYCEEPTSRMISSSLLPFAAFMPSNQTLASTVYRFLTFQADGFDSACLQAYGWAFTIAHPYSVDIGHDVQEGIRSRVDCLARLATDWNGYVGFDLNFDPRVGIGSPPSGYGTAFNKLEHYIYRDILEYGFTGRPIANAFMLAVAGHDAGRRQLVEIADAVVRSYISKCVARSGYLYTVYDVERGRAINPIGDPLGSRLHYGTVGPEEGNYIRNMAEAALDLCRYSTVAHARRCIDVASSFGGFLARIQNSDGSWYRAYTPEGRPIVEPAEWFGGTTRANKSSTATAIPFLVTLARVSGVRSYLEAALRAGDFVLEEIVDPIDYRGGTLDNPNVVDKEGMAYAMSALLHLYGATGNLDYLRGAQRAGGLALTWNFLWDVPFEQGSRLFDCDFKSRGWGGISILWGAGVVDSYSLWFVRDWLKLADLTGEQIYRHVAELVLTGTQQMLELPGRSVGLVGRGMQEEGFACSHQGVDEGMIAKGSTWGALGWVYGAGTYGVWSSLAEKERARLFRSE